MYGDLQFTTIDSLGWNGAAFSWTDREEADVACAGPLATSDVCMGLRMKITCNGIYDFLIIMNLACFIPALAFTSWMVHQLRFGMIGRTMDSATVGYWGCVTQQTSLWRDPCFYVILQLLCFPPGILIGLPAWPIAMLLMRDKFIGLGGLWWGGGQTIFGVQGVVTMGPAYELYVTAAVFLVPVSAYLTLKMRDAHRALVYGGGVDSSEDIAGGANGLFSNGLTALGGGLTGALSYVPNFSWGDPAAPGSGAGAPPPSLPSSSTAQAPPVITYNNSAISGAARQGGGSPSTPSAALPSKAHSWAADREDNAFGDSTLDDMPYGSGSQGGGGGGQASAPPREEEEMENAFGPSGKAI